uniref:coronatine-insensitive protein 1-like n=1 Tax=Erigeron canadensis TaxID=72917 RepID=UPI001CB96A5B|nr:coronatine-insensitive protein 1-like [Erigeron canadensis]
MSAQCDGGGGSDGGGSVSDGGVGGRGAVMGTTMVLNVKEEIGSILKTRNGYTSWLALHNTCFESLTFHNPVIDLDVNDLTLLAKNCSQSLKCVIITSKFRLVDLKDFCNSAVMLQELFYGGDHWAKKEDYYVRWCPNLQFLYVSGVYGNNGLQLAYCPDLQAIYEKDVSDKGRIILAQGCLQLEKISIKLKDISEDALRCVGAHLKNLRWFHMTSLDKTKKSLIPAEGIRALLIGCTKLEKLCINLAHSRRLTPEGMGYIGEYGHHELRRLSLYFSDLTELKILSTKLRVLRIEESKFSKEEDLSFVFNSITTLRYIYVWDEENGEYLSSTRPDFEQIQALL